MKTQYSSGAARFMAALLAFVLLFAGMGAAPAQTAPPPPPDPDHASRWRMSESAKPLPVVHASEKTAAPQADGSPSLQACYTGAPNKLDWTALVFTGAEYYDWNGDIYINRGMCSYSTPVRLTADPGWDTAPRLN